MGSTAAIKSNKKLKNFVSWFEIPVFDIHRASAFYNAIYSMEMELNINGDYAMAFFPAAGGIGGALVSGPGCIPADTGALIYLNAGDDLDNVLGRVELAGGRVIMQKTLISEQAGSFALFLDSEGNRIALHQGSAKAVKNTSRTDAGKAGAKKPSTGKKPQSRKRTAAKKK